MRTRRVLLVVFLRSVVLVFILFCLVWLGIFVDTTVIMAWAYYNRRYKPMGFWNIRKIRLECCEF